MFESLMCLYWAMEPGAFEQFNALLARLPAQGPVDDAARKGLRVRRVNNVAIITLAGVMVKDADDFEIEYMGAASTTAFKQAVESARRDSEITKVVLLIDSPGGSVAALAAAGDAVAALAAEKETVVQVEGQMASAAYYVGSQATRIVANRMDLIGSIGTRIMLYDQSKRFEEAGIKAIAVDTGIHKSAGARGTEITEEQIAEFQRIVDGFNADFLQMVSRGRGMDMDALKTVADGRMYFATDAVSNGLIDGVQSLDQTLAQLLEPNTAQTTTAARNRVRLMSQ